MPTHISSISPSGLSDHSLIANVKDLACRLSRELRVQPSGWRNFLIFLAWYAEEHLKIDPDILDQHLDLDCLEPAEPPDDVDTSQIDFAQSERAFTEWVSRSLCKNPDRARPQYISAKAKPWFALTTALLQLVFPAIVARGEVRFGHRYKTQLAGLRRAWRHANR